MTRKDFQLIAATIAGLEWGRPDANTELRKHVAREFATALRSTNPNFNADRFIAAATKEG